MSKIEFEDRTQHDDDKIKKEIEALASYFYSVTVRMGAASGYNMREILKAMLIASEDMCDMVKDLDVITEEEVKEMKNDAFEIAQRRGEEFRKTGMLEKIKEVMEQTKNIKG